MAQDGDTITYTVDGSKTRYEEDISNIGEIVVEYCDGAGGNDAISNGGVGGRVENVVVDVSSHNTIYLWVADGTWGRYTAGSLSKGGGSTEISFFDTGYNESSDEPFLVGSGGGGGPWADSFAGEGSETGTRNSNLSAGGTPPPLGGEGAPDSSSSGGDGDGAVDDENRGYIIESGTAIKGGGNSAQQGEIKITFKAGAPPAPTNVQITDSSTEDELTLDWDTVADATSYNVYRAEASGATKTDYTLVAEPTSSPYTDTGLEDGERYYYRVTSEN
jgi:hypothetical protein